MSNQIIQNAEGLWYEVVEGGPLPDQYRLPTEQYASAQAAWLTENGGTSAEAWAEVFAANGVVEIFVRAVRPPFAGVQKIYHWDARTGQMFIANERPSVEFYEAERDALDVSDIEGRRAVQDRIDALSRLGVGHARIPDIEFEVVRGP